MQQLLKYLIKKLPIAFTKNQQYDNQTKKVINKVCDSNSSFIDIGCHKGEVLDIVLKKSPNSHHYGFEPIPDLFKKLQKKYKGQSCTFFDIALSNCVGETKFNYVVSNPAYSGLIKRSYDKKNEVDEQILVNTNKLDHLIPIESNISLIKIDVEGGELQVLEGGFETIKRCKPFIIFEHGLGASEFYDSTPEKVFELLTSCGLKISTMKNWLANKSAFALTEFENQYFDKLNYYFIAYP